MTDTDRNQYVLSLGAVGMSALALIFSFLELRTSDRQLDAAVWPYVDLTVSLNADTSGLAVSNKGLGPALVHEFRILYRGEPIHHPLELPQFASGEGANYSVSTASMPGSVLSVGEEVTAFRIEGDDVGRTMQEILPYLEFEICYCSINGVCWDNFSDTEFRQPVAQCRAQPVDVEGALEMFATDAPSDPTTREEG